MSANVKEELKTIQESISALSPETGDIKTASGGGTIESYKDMGGGTGTGNIDLNLYKDYTQMLVDSSLAKSELNFEKKITTVQREVLSEIGNVSEKIKEIKPNYWLIFLAFFLGTVVAIAAIFVPIIPIYTENVVTHQMKEQKTSILSEVQKYIDGKIDEWQKRHK